MEGLRTAREEEPLPFDLRGHRRLARLHDGLSFRCRRPELHLRVAGPSSPAMSQSLAPRRPLERSKPLESPPFAQSAFRTPAASVYANVTRSPGFQPIIVISDCYLRGNSAAYLIAITCTLRAEMASLNVQHSRTFTKSYNMHRFEHNCDICFHSTRGSHCCLPV